MFAASKSGKASGSSPTPTTDASFAYVPLLLETGSASSLNTTVTDSSASPNTVTRTANPSTGWVSPYQTDGYWGNYFAASGDYISVPDAANLELGASDFQMSAWVYLTAYPVVNGTDYASTILSKGTFAGTRSYSLTINGASGTSLALSLTNASATSTNITGSFSFALNTWYAVRATRVSNRVYLFVNGTLLNAGGTAYTDTVSNGTDTLKVGRSNLDATYLFQFFGYISNVSLAIGGTGYSTANYTPATTPTTAASDIKFLSCQSNRFIDNSSVPAVITVNGTPQVTPYFYPSGFTAPAASPGAVLLNGTTQYLSSPAATGGPFDILTGNFTLEMWIYPTSFNSVQSTIIGTRGPLNSNWELRINPSASPANALQFYFTTVGVVASSAAPQLNTWSHVAITRSSNLFTMYVNGISVGTSTFGNGVGATSTLWIGTETPSATTDAFPGYIGNLRIVKGTAVYSGTSTTTPNFTPPSGPLTQTGGTYPSLTNVVTGFSAANTSLLLALSDSNYLSATNLVQNNTFIDSSNYAFPVTRNGTATQGSFTPYWPNGQWSNNFNGSSNLSIASTASLAMGASDFTIEFWVYLRSATNNRTIAWPVAGNMLIYCDNSGYFAYASYGVGNVLASSIVTPLNTWTHIAISRTGTNSKIFVNGAIGASTSADLNNWGQSNVNIGSDIAANFLNGYLSNLRIVKGVGVYTGVFTPPTSPLQKTQAGNGSTIQAITGTQTSLLTCQSNRFVDNSASPLTITVGNGTPQVQAFQPFSPTASYTTALYGGSGYFNGSTDYLSITDGTALKLGSGNFTIEGLVYLSTSGGSQAIYARSEFGIIIGVGSGNFVLFASSDGSSWDLASGITFGTAVANTWMHFAAVRNGANITLYLNGVLGNTVAVSTSTLYEATAPTVGNWNNAGANWWLNGYASNLRVVKGTAVYTGAFKPPTLAPLTTLGTTSAASYTDTTNVNTTFLTPASLLLNMTNAGIYDAAAQNDVTTAGSAVTAVTPAKWSPSSMSFNGSNSYAQALSNPAFTLGASNFTIEFWVYFNSVASGQSVAGRHVLTAAGDWAIYTASTGSLNYYLSSTGATWNLANQISIGSISTGTWYYVALVRNGSVFTPYIGTTPGSTPTTGTTTTTSSALFATTQALTIGAANNSAGYFNGYVQDFRFTVGVARSITTVPSAALPTK